MVLVSPALAALASAAGRVAGPVHFAEHTPPPFSDFICWGIAGVMALGLAVQLLRLAWKPSARAAFLLGVNAVIGLFIAYCLNGYFARYFRGETAMVTVTRVVDHSCDGSALRHERSCTSRYEVWYAETDEGGDTPKDIQIEVMPEELAGIEEGMRIPLQVVAGEPELTAPGDGASIHVFAWMLAVVALLPAFVVAGMSFAPATGSKSTPP